MNSADNVRVQLERLVLYCYEVIVVVVVVVSYHVSVNYCTECFDECK